jgi:hypothetical protein
MGCLGDDEKPLTLYLQSLKMNDGRHGRDLESVALDDTPVQLKKSCRSVAFLPHLKVSH